MPSRLGPRLLTCACLGLLPLLMGCKSPPLDDSPTGPLATHYLTVTRHASSSLSQTDADRIIRQMNEVIRTRDGTDDVACNVNFVQDGPVTVFTQGTGSINSFEDSALLESLPGRVKIVNRINWCGTFSPNIIGCASFFGDSLKVVRHAADQEAILWLHEFGHLEGLEHRNDPNALMNATIGSNRRRITDWECEAFNYGAVISDPVNAE